MRLTREVTCAVVQLFVRKREREKEGETCNHSAGTFTSIDTGVYVSLNFEKYASQGNFFLIFDSDKCRKQNNTSEEKYIQRSFFTYILIRYLRW